MTLYVCNGKRRPFVRWREAENKSRSHRSTAAGRRADRSAGSWNGSSRRSSWRLGGGAAAIATAAVAWRRMLRDFPLPLWRRPNAGRSILARQWLLRRRRRGICGGGVAVVGLLGCLAAFHSVSQLVSPSNLGSAYYYCSGAGGFIENESGEQTASKERTYCAMKSRRFVVVSPIPKPPHATTVWSVNDELSGNLWKPAVKVSSRFPAKRQNHW